jgi:hypothetical protein
MRELEISAADVESVIANPAGINIEEVGKVRYVGYVRGERVRVVVALDEPDLIVTIHRRRR